MLTQLPRDSLFLCCAQAVTHRPMLFPCWASQSLVPGSQFLLSTVSAMSAVLHSPRLSRERFWQLLHRALQGNSCPQEGCPGPRHGRGHSSILPWRCCLWPVLSAQYLHKYLALSNPAGRFQHRDLPFFPLVLSSWGKHAVRTRCRPERARRC